MAISSFPINKPLEQAPFDYKHSFSSINTNVKFTGHESLLDKSLSWNQVTSLTFVFD